MREPLRRPTVGQHHSVVVAVQALLRLCRLRQPIQLVLLDLKKTGTRFELPSSHPGFADDSGAGMDAGQGAAAETGGPPSRQSKRTKQPTHKVLEALAYADKFTNATKTTEESDAIPKTANTADAQDAFGLSDTEWAVVREVGSALAVVHPALEQLQLDWCPTNHGVAYRLGTVCDALEKLGACTANSLSKALRKTIRGRVRRLQKAPRHRLQPTPTGRSV